MKSISITTEYQCGDEDLVTLETRELLTDMPQVYLKIRSGPFPFPHSSIALVRDDAQRLRDWLTEWLEETKR